MSRNLTICRSCANKSLVVLRRKDAYCKECFLASETHKFRAALGKTKMMKPQDNVLVACSGSQSSMALLHLLHSGVTEKHHKKLLFKVNIIFIEEGALFKLSDEERINSVNEVKQLIEEYNFPTYISTISDYFSETHLVGNCLEINKKNDEQLVKLFDSVKSVTSKEDLLSVLRHNLILKLATKLNCSKIFTAEVGDNLAVKLMNNFSLGRGEQASFGTGFCDDRLTHCKILRPLRDFLCKEIVFYNKFHNINYIASRTFTTGLQNNSSIQKLTEAFITNLQVDFPATVYTIFRTGEKLGTNSISDKKTELFCLLCHDELRTKSNNEYSAVDALNISWGTPKVGCSESEESSCCGECIDGAGDGVSWTFNGKKIKENFCYGCAAIIGDTKNWDSLPKYLIQAAVERNNLNDMREKISEFLIDDT
ncbi:hypothetical protein RUM44_005621 [Polyplax serrata]|uniref:Cytoplasmic tRNA 2-thiolation protein 2 n=1 Tax=Polyplax serrata TaxID=468196 RepID=A0ABR1ADW7_POLSC